MNSPTNTQTNIQCLVSFQLKDDGQIWDTKTILSLIQYWLLFTIYTHIQMNTKCGHVIGVLIPEYEY